ncbi:MAG: DUF255 domain-containing protein [Candidatus Eisenbacteria bacterium]|uniref:DUF255 domain-containing protein n=1 Tax=Eiseniibacteriota bacterium TaxID=2212470 RepID=A0A538TVL9_UNCEI|nr:MAG: DUF255 domain-containing protein [Candidatus Eisenbacteria bacterium]
MKAFVRAAAWVLLLMVAQPAHSEDTPLAWRDWDSGFKEARRQKRIVLVDVYTDWCGWCRRMDRDVYSRPEVREYLQRTFVTVKLDAEADKLGLYQGKAATWRALAAQFGVNGYPTTVFLRPEGEYITRVPGYVPAERFLDVLRYIGDGHMDRGVSFQEYLGKAAKGR